MKHLLDANVFVDAKNFYYRYSVCPGFGDWLDTAVGGEFGTIDRVSAELLKGNDELAAWFKARKGASWIAASNGTRTQQAFEKVANWVNSDPKKISQGKMKFLTGADPWILAYALELGATVVTFEGPKNSAKKVSLADACAAFDVPVIKTWDLLELRKVQFVLPKKK